MVENIARNLSFWELENLKQTYQSITKLRVNIWRETQIMKSPREQNTPDVENTPRCSIFKWHGYIGQYSSVERTSKFQNVKGRLNELELFLLNNTNE